MTSTVLWLLLSILSTALDGNLSMADICGFPSAVTDTNHDFIVLESQTDQWSLQVNFSWTRPSGNFDTYYIKLVDKSTRPVYGCSAKEGYLQTTQTWHLFDGLKFGFPYQVHIRLYDNETDKTSFIPGRFDIHAPDCYEKTGSIDYCMLQPIPTTTKARNPRIESVGINEFGNGTDVVISWLPPVQIKGVMDTNSVSYRRETISFNEGVIHFHPADVNWNGDRSQRFSTMLPSLLNDTIYIVEIKPIVTQNDERVFGEGLEFRVNTSLLADSGSQRPIDSTTALHSNTPDYVSSTTLPKSTKAASKNISRLTERSQWVIIFTVIAIIVLCAVVVLLVVRRRRKNQQMTLVSS